MIESERMKLNNWETLGHYFVVLYILLIPIFNFYSIFQIEITKNYSGVRTTSELFEASWPWLIIAVIFLFIQYKRLKFKKVKSTIGTEEFKQIAKKTGDEMKWNFTTLNNNLVIAKTEFNWNSWGELIMIIRKNDEILINSICDPNKKASVASWGRNKKNINAFLKNINSSIKTN